MSKNETATFLPNFWNTQVFPLISPMAFIGIFYLEELSIIYEPNVYLPDNLHKFKIYLF